MGNNGTNGKKLKFPRSCATCHARKVKCDLLKTCSACLRHARSTGRDINSVICVYSNPMPFHSPSKPNESLATKGEEIPLRELGKRNKNKNKRKLELYLGPVEGMGLGQDIRRINNYTQPKGDIHDDDYSDELNSSNWLPTPIASPSSSTYSSIYQQDFIPLFSPTSPSTSSPTSSHYPIPPPPTTTTTLNKSYLIDFNAFHSQPYDSPISEFNFGSTFINDTKKFNVKDSSKEMKLTIGNSVEGSFFEEFQYPSPSSVA